MMKRIYLLSVFTLFLVFSCKSPEIAEAPPVETVELKNPINDFTWKAMNSWYNWQDNVPNLADSKDDDVNSYHTYLNGFNTPEDLFKSLRYKSSSVDKYSWFIEDYIEQEKRFQGITKTFGFTTYNKAIEVGNDGIILLILKVSKGSTAEQKGIKRGDIIIGLNGQRFTTSNFNTLIEDYYKDSVELILGKGDGVTEKTKVSITREEVSDPAIHLTKVFDDVNGKKVGYLVYNGFRSSYDKDLNNEFGKLKAAGINELILDLRYNGGGSVLTCGYLASMIYGEGVAEKDVFAKTIYNKKHPNEGFTLPFLSGIFQYNENGKYIQGADIPLNRLTGINKLYVLTTKWTASASEMIINGLRPYMDVITIGQTTSGKNVGSITLYDSPNSDYKDKETANKSHRFAMQPIVFQIYNKEDKSDYASGFTPDIDLDLEYKNWSGILPFGDENEVMLKTALNKIKGVSAKMSTFSLNPNARVLNKNIKTPDITSEMYFESNYMSNLK